MGTNKKIKNLILNILLVYIIGLLVFIFSINYSEMAFDSIENIMRNVKYGWFLRYLHSNSALFFFIFLNLLLYREIDYLFLNIYINFIVFTRVIEIKLLKYQKLFFKFFVFFLCNLVYRLKILSFEYICLYFFIFNFKKNIIISMCFKFLSKFKFIFIKLYLNILFCFLLILYIILFVFFNLSLVQYYLTILIFYYYIIYEYKIRFFLSLFLYLYYIINSLKNKNYKKLFFNFSFKIIFFIIFIITNGQYFKTQFNDNIKDYIINFFYFIINNLGLSLSCVSSNTQFIIGVGIGVIAIGGVSYYGYKSYNNYQREYQMQFHKDQQLLINKRIDEIVQKKNEELFQKENELNYYKTENYNLKEKNENLLIKNNDLTQQIKIEKTINSDCNLQNLKKLQEVEQYYKNELTINLVELDNCKKKLNEFIEDNELKDNLISKYKKSESDNNINFNTLKDSRDLFYHKYHKSKKMVNELEQKCETLSNKLEAVKFEKNSLIEVNKSNVYFYSEKLDSLNIEPFKRLINEIPDRKVIKVKLFKSVNFYYKQNILPNYEIGNFNFGINLLSGISEMVFNSNLFQFGIFKLAEQKFADFISNGRSEALQKRNKFFSDLSFSVLESLERKLENPEDSKLENPEEKKVANTDRKKVY
jgi:hypothetical protein